MWPGTSLRASAAELMIRRAAVRGFGRLAGVVTLACYALVVVGCAGSAAHVNREIVDDCWSEIGGLVVTSAGAGIEGATVHVLLHSPAWRGVTPVYEETRRTDELGRFSFTHLVGCDEPVPAYELEVAADGFRGHRVSGNAQRDHRIVLEDGGS